MTRTLICLSLLCLFYSCGSDDGQSFDCQKVQVTILLNDVSFDYETITTGYATAVDGEVYKRAVEILATRADGSSINILFSSIVQAFNNNCLDEKEYFERRDLSFCKMVYS